MGDAFGSQLAALIIACMLVIPTVFLIGLAAIPLLRAKKTGRLEWKIGRRFSADGSEPSMGGVVAALGFAAWFFPLAAFADLNGSITQNSRGDLIFAGIYVIMIMCVGAAEDRLRKFLARPAGLPAAFKQLLIFLLSLTLLLSFSKNGDTGTAVLLPFRLGYADAGVFYYPVTAFFMTAAVNVFKLHFCFGSDYSTAVGGLCELTGAVSLLAVGLCCEIVTAYGGALLADIGAGACIGMLLFTFPPSKIWSGESGSMFIGALFAASVVLSGLELLLLTAAVPQLADLAAAVIHYIRFKHIPKPQRGDISPRRPLRMLWREKGFGSHTVLLLFALAGLAGAALSLIFAVYAKGIVLVVD
ncbi:MAG: hypothetical protein IKO27_01875 [Ruminococcus sp.]|nr:hypothetical protein [Ruminococcus sp.]